MKNRIQQGFTLIELLVVITIIAILASLALPTFGKIQEKGYITKGISNCKQIITTLRIYSTDNNGSYPDASTANKPNTSNQAFQLLFDGGQCDSEQIYGCPSAQYGVPDGNIGTSPYFGNGDCVKTRENHWAMAAGLTDSAAGTYPLVWEGGTGGDKTYDPNWNADAAGLGSQGRTWSGGRVIVGMNDSSVALQKCAASKGPAVKLAPVGTGGGAGDLFTIAGGGTTAAANITVLEVE
jgi:type IV pilus assembly protein PilA